MNAWSGSGPRALSWLAVFVLAGAATAATPSEAELRIWLGDLDADSFAVREAAMRKLSGAGEEVKVLLQNAVAGGSPETAWRAEVILQRVRSKTHAVAEARRGIAVAESCSAEPAVETGDTRLSPDPPPDADIGQALAPPPQMPSIDSIAEQVLIADAFVSPEFTTESAGGAGPVVKSEPRVTPSITALRADSPRAVVTLPSVTLVRQPATPVPISFSRENQPRLMNFFQRARAFLGLSTR